MLFEVPTAFLLSFAAGKGGSPCMASARCAFWMSEKPILGLALSKPRLTCRLLDISVSATPPPPPAWGGGSTLPWRGSDAGVGEGSRFSKDTICADRRKIVFF